MARRIAERVEQCGATAFLDDADIAVGDDFEERILQALDSAKELLVLLTPFLLKKRDLININDLDVYFTELRERIASYRARGA